MSTDYIPRSDADFLQWAQTYATVLNANLAALGFLPADGAAVQTKVSTFSSSIAALMLARAAVTTGLHRKDTDRADAEALIRSQARKIQANDAVDDGLKGSLGLTVRDGTMTSAASVIGHRAAGWVDTSERLLHTVHFHDQGSESKAKPAGIKGCEIWVKIGAAPQSMEGKSGNPADMQFLALDSATPYIAGFAQADAGKTAYYILRWLANDGTPGPWSETIEATIVG